ncbi:unnamed protein product [Sphagnum troendelagicum]
MGRKNPNVKTGEWGSGLSHCTMSSSSVTQINKASEEEDEGPEPLAAALAAAAASSLYSFCSTVFFRSADVKDIRRWILLDFYPSSSSSLHIASQLCDSCVVPVCGLCLESHTAVGLPSFVMRESCSQAGCGRGAG